MRKRVFVAFVLACALAATAIAQTIVDNDFSGPLPAGWIKASGTWEVRDGKLVQADSSENMAVLNIPCRQSGVMQYEFDLQYVDGFQDNYGGFGFHILVSDPTRGRAWGDGTSGLLWLTLDTRTYGPGIFAQAYASTSPTKMELYPPRPIAEGNEIRLPDQYVQPEYLAVTIPVKIVVDIPGGEIRLYDPLDMNTYYTFFVSIPISSGSYFALRTNSLAATFDNLKITKLQ
jgi:hypothetical protein